LRPLTGDRGIWAGWMLVVLVSGLGCALLVSSHGCRGRFVHNGSPDLVWNDLRFFSKAKPVFVMNAECPSGLADRLVLQCVLGPW
jgi:hypothetical protein